MNGKSFSHRVMERVLTQGFLMMWASYVLALLDKPQIAEDLSKVVAGTVVFSALGYFGKSGIENLSKHNSWPDKKKSEETGGESA